MLNDQVRNLPVLTAERLKEEIYDLPVMIDDIKTTVLFSKPIIVDDGFEYRLDNVEVIEEDIEEKEDKIIKIPKEVELSFSVYNPDTRKVKKKYFYGKINERIELKGEKDEIRRGIGKSNRRLQSFYKKK